MLLRLLLTVLLLLQMSATTTLLAVMVLLGAVPALAWEEVDPSYKFANKTFHEMQCNPVRRADSIAIGTVALIDVWGWCGIATLSHRGLCEIASYGPPLPEIGHHLPLKVVSMRVKEPFRALDYTALISIIDARLHFALNTFPESCRVLQDFVRDYYYTSLFYHAVDVWLERHHWRCPLSQESCF